MCERCESEQGKTTGKCHVWTSLLPRTITHSRFLGEDSNANPLHTSTLCSPGGSFGAGKFANRFSIRFSWQPLQVLKVFQFKYVWRSGETFHAFRKIDIPEIFYFTSKQPRLQAGKLTPFGKKNPLICEIWKTNLLKRHLRI